MNTKKLLFVINQNAGKAEIKTKALDVIDLFTRNGFEVTVHVTQRVGEASDLVSTHAGEYDRIVCCGGDGTLNETVTGMMHSDIRPPLGYLPAGTVNDFASSLHISKNLLDAARDALSETVFDCDVGAMNGRYFTYIAAFGAFTEVSYQTPRQTKNLLGRAAYFLEAIRLLPAIKAYHMKIEHDGIIEEGDYLFGMFANSTSIGGFRLGDMIPVSMDDGLLEVLLIRDPKNARAATQLIGSILSLDLSSDYVTGFRTSKLTVTADEEFPWTLDGEFGGMVKDAKVELLPRALRIITGNQEVVKT